MRAHLLFWHRIFYFSEHIHRFCKCICYFADGVFYVSEHIHRFCERICYFGDGVFYVSEHFIDFAIAFVILAIANDKPRCVYAFGFVGVRSLFILYWV
ncbi:hypothetical protein [Nostoc sp. C117]|uniref:hypothetical protein n=1 Tax=Nostoc sp. C117 TaxID=3349875 RepID=UPI00370D60D6